MLIETHVIQNFAPSNLNRDDTGSPKDCMFGGYRRARISSQCLKRAMRSAFGDLALLDKPRLAIRTRRMHEALAVRLTDRGHEPDAAIAVARAAVEAIGLRFDQSGRTQYLVLVGADELARLAELAHERWETLMGAADNKERVDQKTANAFTGVLTAGSRAVDLALFGRMVADRPEAGLEGSSQVAHAISTHAVTTEFDFYTAVDDLNPNDTAAAGMMGTVEFNSACFYRYANLNVDALRENLGGDADVAADAVRAWLNAVILAVPSGKQNSMAAHNPPSLVLAVARGHGNWSLGNAFARPVRPEGPDSDIVTTSCRALGKHWARLAAMYGLDGVAGSWVAQVDGDLLSGVDAVNTDVPGLVDAVVTATS